MKYLVKVAAFALIFAAAATVGFGQDEKDEKEEKVHRFTATAQGTKGAFAARTVFLNFRITKFTTDEEVMEYIKILKEGGTNALRRKLEKVEVGRVYTSAGTGNDVAVARVRQTEKGYLVTFVTARRLGFFELRQGSRSTDYPFGFFQILFDEDGKGKGQVLVATKFSFNKENQFVIESLGDSPFRLVNVRHK